MLRTLILGASALAMAPLTAIAQDAKIESDMTAEAAMMAEPLAIIDASQVETKEEAKLYAASEFTQADLNKDGSIDKNEFIAYASVRAPINDPALSIPDEVVEANEAAAETKVENETTAAATAEEQFAELSKGDEEISQVELVDTRVAQFEEADANHDEALDDTERLQFAALTKIKAPESTL